MHVLCFNSGSSSLKWSVEDVTPGPEPRVDAVVQDTIQSADHVASVDQVFARLQCEAIAVDAVGHRCVFGGAQFVEPVIVTEAVRTALHALTDFAPLHIPHELAILDAVTKAAPRLPQVVCFDTAFHAALPEAARRLPLPQRLREGDLRRYGFHGLSYEYLLWAYPQIARGRVVIAHLGSGASLAAIHDGMPMDTSMGLTPLGGVVMGTRPGDLDPGVLTYLLRTGRVDRHQLDDALNAHSGLLGLSGVSSDIREIEKLCDTNADARIAVEIFCRSVKKAIGSYAAILGGLDRIVFTAGIGENSAAVRRSVIDGLEFMGCILDDEKNEANALVISPKDAAVEVNVFATNENATVARHTEFLIGKQTPDTV